MPATIAASAGADDLYPTTAMMTRDVELAFEAARCKRRD